MSAADELAVLRGGAAAVDRSDRGAILLTGPDSFSFLQALVSADVDALADGEGAASLLLTPQGKLGFVFRLLRVGDDAWFDCDPGLGAPLAAALDRFRIRVKAQVLDRTAGFGVVSLVGPDAVGAFEEATGISPPTALHHHVGWAGGRVVRTEWAGAPGLDLVGPAPIAVPAGFVAVGAEAFDAYRIEAGVAWQPVDLPDGMIPQEAYLDQSAVSFTKGCFLGQELVCRIDTRGHVNRLLRRVVAIEGDWPEAGAGIVVDGKEIGALTSVSSVELAVGGLGLVRREVEPPAAVELRWPGGSASARVARLTPDAAD